MAKLNNAQIEALVSEARQKIEDANQLKIEKFSKTNKKLAEYLKLQKQEDDANEKRKELERQTSSNFVKLLQKETFQLYTMTFQHKYFFRFLILDL